MKKLVMMLVFLLVSGFTIRAQVQLNELRTDNLHDPLGIDDLRPQFSWKLVTDQRNIRQQAYEIRIGYDKSGLSKGKQNWASGKVLSDQSILVPYAGPSLETGKKYYWQVRVWDNQGRVSPWSEIASWQMGLLKTSDWKAGWIVPGYTEDSLFPSPLMRREFSSVKKIKSATAYITAHGLYEAMINGKKIGDACLTPGWTSYNKRLQYQAYDVTGLIQNGKNAVGVTLGDGWYRGNFSFDHRRNIYGKDIALLFQLEIEYADGSREQIISDDTWKSSTGAIRAAGIYAGEIIDARKEQPGWGLPGFNDAGWTAVKKADFSKEVLVATINEPVKKQEQIKPLKIFKTPAGEQVIDFGQNLVGWIRLKATGRAGDTIRVFHAEVLDKKGNFYTENLRNAKAVDQFILKGGAEEVFEPRFSWHGFRYVKLVNYPGNPDPANFTAQVIYSDMPVTGTFNCSNEKINQLQHNIEWGLRGNFLDVPTDCPQRDERMGWTGDAQVFFRTASYLRGVHNFFAKWLKDLAADQVPAGSVPHVIPNILGDKGWAAGGSAGWSDASTIIPWEMYDVYGDKRIIEDQYASMKAWVEYMRSQSSDYLWNKGDHFGDWLYYSVIDDNDGRSAITNKYLIAQCFFAHSTQLLVHAAALLGKKQDVEEYSALLQKVKEAFLKEYTTPNGATMSNTQTSYVLALQFDLFPEPLRQQAADRLAANIKQYNNHLTTGFLGTPYLCHVLSRYGYTDLAYTLLLQETYPSWLYPVTKGATTIWERWDGIRTNGDFQAVTMNSFNHYAYGAIGDWMYRVMAGLDKDAGAIGYKELTVRPRVSDKFSFVSASYETGYGRFASAWKINDGELELQVTIPANTRATVYIPCLADENLSEQGQPLENIQGLVVMGREDGYLKLKLGSGRYDFKTIWKKH